MAGAPAVTWRVVRSRVEALSAMHFHLCYAVHDPHLRPCGRWFWYLALGGWEWDEIFKK